MSEIKQGQSRWEAKEVTSTHLMSHVRPQKRNLDLIFKDSLKAMRFFFSRDVLCTYEWLNQRCSSAGELTEKQTSQAAVLE